MSDTPDSEPTRAVCDGKDHGVSAERLAQLQAEAQAFNRLLQTNKIDASGTDHDVAVRQAAGDFYQWISDWPAEKRSNEARAFDASKALYEQLTTLPIGERRALANFVQDANAVQSAQDDAMPVVEINIDSHAFINDLTVKYPWLRARDIKTGEMGYASEHFKFGYRGMCAAFEQNTPQTGDHGFSIPGTGGFSFFHRR